MFLFRLHRIALFLQPLRPLCFVLAFCGLSLTVYALLDGADTSSLLLRLAVMLTLWGLMLYSFVQVFRTIPAPVLPKDNFFVRCISKGKNLLYQLLALLVLALGLSVLSMSLKLLLV